MEKENNLKQFIKIRYYFNNNYYPIHYTVGIKIFDSRIAC